MKKLFATILTLLALSAAFAKESKLSVWSFTDEVQTIIDQYYTKDNPKVKFDFNIKPADDFCKLIDKALSSKKNAPDVFALDPDWVRNYVEQGQEKLLDLSDVYDEIKGKVLPYPAQVGTHNGKVYALAWNASPGAMFYRRSLAKKYLGTDDPAEVQKMFDNWNKFLEAARTLCKKSSGKCKVVFSIEDLYYPFLDSRKTPWVVDGEVCVDPAMEKYLELCKIMCDEGLCGGSGQWSEAWFDGIKNNVNGTNEVFCYFLPTWGLNYMLKPNSGHIHDFEGDSDSFGDWAMCEGPSPYFWGGTWIVASKNTKNAKEAKAFIKYICSNDKFSERWAMDTGDFVPNRNTISKVQNSFQEPFLQGQMPYAEFAKIAEKLDGKNRQGKEHYYKYDFFETAREYISGGISKDEALALLKKKISISSKLPFDVQRPM